MPPCGLTSFARIFPKVMACIHLVTRDEGVPMLFKAFLSPSAPRGEVCTPTIRGPVGAGAAGVARRVIRAATLLRRVIAIGSVVAVMAAEALGIEVEGDTELDMQLLP
jgi:hypothetical protein